MVAVAVAAGVGATGSLWRRGSWLRTCEVRAAHAERTCGAALPRRQGPVPGNAFAAAANGPERRAWAPWEARAARPSWPSRLPRQTRHRQAGTPRAAWPRWTTWLLPDGQGRPPGAPWQGWTTGAARASGRARNTRGPGPSGPARTPWPPWAFRHHCPWKARCSGDARAPRIPGGARASGGAWAPR